jgi:hypothetical protein
MRLSSLYFAAPSVCAVLGQGCQGGTGKLKPATESGAPLNTEVPTINPSAKPLPQAEAPLGLYQAMKRWAGASDTRVFYTWTTKEQADEIRKGGAVLQRSFSPGKGFASYDHFLSDLAQAGDPTARLLWHEGFAKSRFAWSNAFGIVTFEERSFGDELLRITLADTSSVLTLRPDAVRFAPAPEAPDAIGAVEFRAGNYSEYILPNESAIAKVEIATSDLKADIRAQILFLKAISKNASMTSLFFVHRNIVIGMKQVSAAIALLTAYLHEKYEPYERGTMTRFELGAPRSPIAQLCKELGLPIKSQHIDHLGQKHFTVVARCPPEPCWQSEGHCFVHPVAFQ